MDKVVKNKRGLELPVPLQVIKQVQKNYLLIIYYLTKFGVIYSGFWVTPKIIPVNVCKSVHDIINYSTSICYFESGKVERRGKNTKKWISQDRKKLFRWNKKHFFTVFEGLSFVEKLKIWWKIADTRFKALKTFKILSDCQFFRRTYALWFKVSNKATRQTSITSFWRLYC